MVVLLDVAPLGLVLRNAGLSQLSSSRGLELSSQHSSGSSEVLGTPAPGDLMAPLGCTHKHTCIVRVH